ncbi:hypothetical protein B0T26DRAFT_672082 [Lasiosphaeria miniovina]|uniref:Uncharacterized protein n=1 Tax=Lasiosphaeria miniovina TaxID=1954250 RepID=A0AA40B4K2_9PEZI|nr:uncharacterized protein B0T26DRAFT_672082 [Lasiosphaeria miniovina]KAK0727412.1 hypothetical protein B0T26DRAFT_672082 [Lasiosphaeria miniovina]
MGDKPGLVIASRIAVAVAVVNKNGRRDKERTVRQLGKQAREKGKPLIDRGMKATCRPGRLTVQTAAHVVKLEYGWRGRRQASHRSAPGNMTCRPVRCKMVVIRSPVLSSKGAQIGPIIPCCANIPFPVSAILRIGSGELPGMPTRRQDNGGITSTEDEGKTAGLWE